MPDIAKQLKRTEKALAVTAIAGLVAVADQSITFQTKERGILAL